ncbi:ABC transporter ATP-binding protein [Streptococcus gallolyticus]|uniref:ABC transporter ATP-binding protein n=1 Tax=Streptococcus gallolyticus TaxID=315405 RepID=A0A368UE66_9STRE|nr:ABC transporter ATP-binding protein [Streptococcus gallolyticus]RCW17224.1 ABC transporter ATP-binding protein [Streptococcus gallolyticus]
MNNLAINVKKLTKEFQIDKNKTISVLKGISLSAYYGEFISILGISGSGKTTLLNCMSSLSRPTSGEVMINGKNPYKLRNSFLAKVRREEISFIFQSYNLVPSLPVFENIVLPLRLSNKKVNKDKVMGLLKKLNFNAELDNLVGHLSGGEQQKVAICRAILSDSKIIFADEPTGAMDSKSRQLIFELLRELANDGKCVIMVTHDIELASQTDKAFILKDGFISQEITDPSSKVLYQELGTVQ